MSITDELRKYADTFDTVAEMKSEGGISLTAIRLRTIAKRIDAAHEREMREQYTKGHNDGFDEGFASADDWDVDHAEELAEHGWVELPKDADGVPIHVGDRLNGYDKTITVGKLELGKHGWFIADADEDWWSNSRAFEHSDEPTVESLLRDFYVYAEPGIEHHRTDVDSAVLAEYADRIREAMRNE